MISPLALRATRGAPKPKRLMDSATRRTDAGSSFVGLPGHGVSALSLTQAAAAWSSSCSAASGCVDLIGADMAGAHPRVAFWPDRFCHRSMITSQYAG